MNMELYGRGKGERREIDYSHYDEQKTESGAVAELGRTETSGRSARDYGAGGSDQILSAMRAIVCPNDYRPAHAAAVASGILAIGRSSFGNGGGI